RRPPGAWEVRELGPVCPPSLPGLSQRNYDRSREPRMVRRARCDLGAHPIRDFHHDEAGSSAPPWHQGARAASATDTDGDGVTGLRATTTLKELPNPKTFCVRPEIQS